MQFTFTPFRPGFTLLMAPVRTDPSAAASKHLADQPVSAYLASGESVQATLSNVRTGVLRADDDGTHVIEPGEDCGAVAVLTDRRTLFVVGHSDGDESASVPYAEFASVETRTETLTRSLIVETGADATWEFTARDMDALDDAMGFLAAELPGRFLDRAHEHRQAAAEAADAEGDEAEDRQRRIEALEAAVDAFRRATTVVEDPDVDLAAAREEAEGAIQDLFEAHIARARECRSVGNWSAEAGDVQDALDHYDDSLDGFERALELARTYPPGDADAIAAEKEDLEAKRDTVEVSASVSSAGE